MKVKDYLEVAEDKLKHLKRTLNPDGEVFCAGMTGGYDPASILRKLNSLGWILACRPIAISWKADGDESIEDALGFELAEDGIKEVKPGDIIIE